MTPAEPGGPPGPAEPPGPAWSDAVAEAGWIAERLAPFGSEVSSVVPGGFQAYARVLHPVESPDRGDRLVRWRDVASWSGVALGASSQFHSISMPRQAPAAPPFWDGQGPREGALYEPDARALSEVLRRHTSTPESCFFCVWDGYGWEARRILTSVADTDRPSDRPKDRASDRASDRPKGRTRPTFAGAGAGGGAGEVLPDVVPSEVRGGPRVRLPDREYLLYTGPIEAVIATVGLAGDGQTANLWWPADRAFCVASEIDLAWSYVGGSLRAVADVLGDGRLEAVPAHEHDKVAHVEAFVEALAERAADELLARGEATMKTSLGEISASLVLPRRRTAGVLRTSFERTWNGSSHGGSSALRERDKAELRKTVVFRLTLALLELGGG